MHKKQAYCSKKYLQNGSLILTQNRKKLIKWRLKKEMIRGIRQHDAVFSVTRRIDFENQRVV